MSPSLPRLLYIGDQPVESTCGGAALLYRLLQNYPADKLLILESNLGISKPERRIAGVAYERFTIGIPRLTRTRLYRQHAAFLFTTAAHRYAQISAIARRFRPEAILTLSHLYSWRTAAVAAQRLKVPLHLILHDDAVRMSFVPDSMHKRVDQALGAVYRAAASRLCIAPYMEQIYAAAYGAGGDVVYPSWASDTAGYESPPPTSGRKSLVFAYAGSVHNGGYNGDLKPLALALLERGHTLLLYSNVGESNLKAYDLDLPNVVSRQFLPFHTLIARLREDADVLVAPMSFEPRLKRDMELCFPSKLADYTAIGLPLLVWGPPYCSAVKWARDNPGVAAVVDDQNGQPLPEGIKHMENASLRQSLASAAIAAGKRLFSHDSVTSTFYKALTRSLPNPA